MLGVGHKYERFYGIKVVLPEAVCVTITTTTTLTKHEHRVTMEDADY